MRNENKRMSGFLAGNGLPGVTAKRIRDGSLRDTWRLTIRSNEPGKLFEMWTVQDAATLNLLGFRWIDGSPLTWHSGNGGLWQVFVRGHDEMAVG